MHEDRNGGLLSRASLIRSREEPIVDAGIEAGAGISADDRREILAKIEEISKGAQLSAESRVFAVKARRSGILFPIVVNLLAALAVAGGIYGLSFLSARREAALAESETAVSSAEGKLLAAFKKESQGQLEAKDREIVDFQNRIGALDKERGELAASIDERVKAKETELRAALKSELDKEKARLVAGGLSEASVQAKLDKYEADKTVDLQRELASYQQKADEEKKAAEANYARMRDEYQKSIAGLAEERRRIQADSDRREAELKSSLEAKSAAAEAKSATAQAGLAEAKAELAAIEESRRKSEAAEDRIVGLYAAVRSALRERRYADASVGAASLRAYLDDPSLLSLPSLARRRDADIFAADSLAALAKTELDRQSLDSKRLIDQAELLNALREASLAGSAALKAGQTAQAEAKYREALEAVPEILAAHEYFSSKSASEEGTRRAKLDAALGEAGAAYKRGDKAAAAEAYGAALEYLPLEAGARAEISSRLGEAGALAYDAKRRTADTRSARAPMAQAKAELEAKSWAAALGDYLEVLASYPSADQGREAATGIEKARAGLDAEAASRAEAAARESADLKAEIERLSKALSDENDKLAEIARISRSEGRAELESVVAAREARIAELEGLLAEAQSSTKASAKGSVAAQGAAAGTAASLESLKAENARLQAAASSYESILSSYAAYQKADAGAAGQRSLLDSKASLDDFLSGPEAKAAFPDLRDRVARLEAAFQEAGAREVLYNAVDISENAARIKDSGERDRYFRDVESRYASSPAMLAYIKSLKTWIK